MRPVKKTSLMRAVERAHGGRDIRQVIQDLYREHGTKEAMAEQLGISRFGLDTWIKRLGGSERTELVFTGTRQEQESCHA